MADADIPERCRQRWHGGDEDPRHDDAEDGQEERQVGAVVLTPALLYLPVLRGGDVLRREVVHHAAAVGEFLNSQPKVKCVRVHFALKPDTPLTASQSDPPAK